MNDKEGIMHEVGGGSFLSRGISRCKGPEVGMSLACSWGSKKKPGRAGATRGRGQRRVDEVREEMGPQILQGLEGCGRRLQFGTVSSVSHRCRLHTSTVPDTRRLT